MAGKGKASRAAAKAKDAAEAAAATAPKETGNLWARAFSKEATLTPREILTAAHWLRQGQALVMGVLFGFFRITGFPAISAFVAGALAGPAFVLQQFHEIDEDEIAKAGTLQLEGMFPAFALFILSWILSYTTFL